MIIVNNSPVHQGKIQFPQAQRAFARPQQYRNNTAQAGAPPYFALRGKSKRMMDSPAAVVRGAGRNAWP